jgi:hypothetical protein
MKRASERGSVGNFFLLLILIAGLGALYAFVIDPTVGEKYTGLNFMGKPQPLTVTAAEEDAAPAPSGEVTPGEASATPPPDPGPGSRPLRSGSNGSMLVVESAIRKEIGLSADITYKDWSEPTEGTYEGKKAWVVTVKAGVITPGEARKGRVDRDFTAYFRDGKLLKVIEGN